MNTSILYCNLYDDGAFGTSNTFFRCIPTRFLFFYEWPAALDVMHGASLALIEGLQCHIYITHSYKKSFSCKVVHHGLDNAVFVTNATQSLECIR